MLSKFTVAPIVSNLSFLAIVFCFILGACASDEAEPEFLVRVVGQLAEADMTAAQAMHDAVAAGGEAEAQAAGDFGHDALLGTALLGTTENEFLGIDRWSDRDGMTGFYSNPDIASGFATLFEGQPAVEMFEWQPDWHGWGDLTSGDGPDEYFFIMVRGRLASADGVEAQAMHDAVAAGGEADALAAGDVAHVVFLGLEDSREYLAFDIWTGSSNIESFYSNQAFQEGITALFDGPPTVGVYASTDWHQW